MSTPALAQSTVHLEEGRAMRLPDSETDRAFAFGTGAQGGLLRILTEDRELVVVAELGVRREIFRAPREACEPIEIALRHDRSLVLRTTVDGTHYAFRVRVSRDGGLAVDEWAGYDATPRPRWARLTAVGELR